MTLNPFYHLRKYKEQAAKIHTLERQNFDLEIKNQRLVNLNKSLETQLNKIRQELYEIEQDFDLVVIQKTLTRKEARELRNKHKDRDGKPKLPR